jgi:hypothetical protein
VWFVSSKLLLQKSIFRRFVLSYLVGHHQCQKYVFLFISKSLRTNSSNVRINTCILSLIAWV